jgi:hypothetical protein
MIKDFLLFRRMLFPYLVQILFWSSVFICIFLGVASLFHREYPGGVLMIIFGPIVMRMIAEYIIVIFRINDTLTDIQETMASRKPPTTTPTTTTIPKKAEEPSKEPFKK